MSIKKIQFLLTLLVLALALGRYAQAQSSILYSDIQYDTIPGVDSNLLSLDIYKPVRHTDKMPVIINIHGGYWRSGDKRVKRSKAEFFIDSGYVFVSINYRLSPNPSDTLSSTGVRFPTHPQDCAKAVAWVFNNIDHYGGDTSKVSLIGHSAGAHLALLLSTNEKFLLDEGIPLHRIKCTCSLDAGVFDLAEELYQAGSRVVRREPLINAFGRDTSLYDDASPQCNIREGKKIPWIHLVHQNTSDRIYSHTRFADSLIKNGFSNVSLFNADPYDHGTINAALGNPLDSIGETHSVMLFFKNCLANTKITGIHNWKIKQKNLFIYPNPSTSFIHTDCKNGFEIYNSTGQLVKQSLKASNKISIADLNSGLYILRVDNKVGKFLKMN